MDVGESLEQKAETCPHLGKLDAKDTMLAFHPAGADAELETAPRHLVDRRGCLGDHARMAEGERSHQNGQLDGIGLSGEPCNRGEGIGGGDAFVAGQVMVGASERGESGVLRCDGQATSSL